MTRPSLPSTLWSQVAEAARGAPDALDALTRRYLDPVYAFVRATGASPEDAEDLTQEFFLHVIERGTLDRADPARGRFRAFLVTCLKHFLADQADRGRAKKRGGDRRHVSLDVAPVERLLTTRSWGQDPQRLFDQRWAQATLERALSRLHAGLSPSAGQVFALAYGEGALPHEEIARRTGLSADAVAASVYRTRKKLRLALLEEIRDTVHDERDADAELGELFAALGG